MSLSREEIIRMAYAAGLFNDDQSPLPEFLEHFANAAYDAGAAAEREQSQAQINRLQKEVDRYSVALNSCEGGSLMGCSCKFED